MQNYICNSLDILDIYIYLLTNTLIFINTLHSINYNVETALSISDMILRYK